MIRVVANLFAGAIGIMIILALGAIALGIFMAMGGTTAGTTLQDASTIGTVLMVGGVSTLFSLGMACVLLDIMFNVRKISESKGSGLSPGNGDRHRTEPEM